MKRSILFKEDWKEFPTAFPDTQTTNQSFLKLVDTYAKMGIENCAWPLTLLQKDLVGVDPYSPDLDQATKMKIIAEANANPWYYFRELARVPPTSGTVPRPFKANRGNMALYWSFFNHIDFGLLQPRQTGKSVSTDVLNTGIMYIWGSNTTIYLITKDAPLRHANIKRLKQMRELLPDYIDYIDRFDTDNSEMLTCIRLTNTYKSAVGRNDPIAADKLGRGLTVPIIHFDELAYISLIGTTLPVALSSGNAARREAAEIGQLYGNIYTTTAGNIVTRDGKFAHDFMTGGAVWSERFMDLQNREELYNVVDKQSPGEKPMIYGAFSHRQLGYSDEWLYQSLRENNAFGEIADRDFLNIWTTGGEGSPLSLEQKETVKRSVREPNWTEITDDGYVVRWYIPRDQIESRMSSCKIMMGTDPSELLGQNNDATGVVGIDITTNDVLFTGRYNESNAQTLATFIAKLLVKYPNITWVPERKSLGIAMLDIVILILHSKGIDPFKRIFNRVVDEQHILVSEFNEIQKPVTTRNVTFYDRFKRYFGYNTSGSGRYSRDTLFKDALPSVIDLAGHRLHDDVLINEIMAITIRNGRLDHKVGAHDDMLLSLLFAHWVLIRGQNLTYYGIKSNEVLTRAKRVEENLSRYERAKLEQEQKYRDEFEDLLEKLKNERNTFTQQSIELKLRVLSKQINLDEHLGMGIDAVIQQVKDERSRKVRNNHFNNNRIGYV